MRSTIIKRSLVIDGHKTSISLEEAFWRGLKDICEERGMAISAQVKAIDSDRSIGNLSSAVRLFVLDHFRTGAREANAPVASADAAEAPRPLS
jgi:predicted DNA-binding ribbon-helix-helix protein